MNFRTPKMRRVIVNADDFGLSAGINRGIVEAHERGIVTSTSLMVRGDAAAAAADYGRQDSRLSVGLHIDLAEWIYRDDAWSPLYQVVDLADPAAVEREVRR
jgi:glycosyltransferase involved in cell wall biosynthesis